MTTATFLAKVSESLNVETSEVSRDTTPDTLAEWDSLGHLDILSVVDEELGVPIDDPQIQNFKSIGELIDLLTERGVLSE